MNKISFDILCVVCIKSFYTLRLLAQQSLHNCSVKLLPVRDLYLAFVTNFSVTSSIRLLFFSLEGRKCTIFKNSEVRTKHGSLLPLFLFFSPIATYGSSASAILSRSHVLDCEWLVFERQSCAKPPPFQRKYTYAENVNHEKCFQCPFRLDICYSCVIIFFSSSK